MNGSELSATSRRSRGRRVAPTIAALALALGLSACAGDDADDAATTTTSSGETTSTTEATSTTAEGASGDATEITAVNYAFEGVPDTFEAGGTLSLTNASEDEVHELILLRIDDDETRPLEELIGLAEEEATEVTRFQGVSVALPGEDGMVVDGDLTLAEPGRYALMCFIPTGADPQVYRDLFASPTPPEGPPDVEGGPPHVANGMYAELTVE